MKKILMVVLALGFISPVSHAQTAPVQIQLTSSTSEIFNGQVIAAQIHITNISKSALELPSPDFSSFKNLLSIDNPQLQYPGGVGLTSVNGKVPTKTLKPGESLDTKVGLYVANPDNSQSPVTFKMGFKISADAETIWSNPVTIAYKKDEELPIKIEASLETDTIDISDPQKPRPIIANLIITNTSSEPQNIGVAGVCGLHELNDLKSDNENIVIDSGIASCLSSMVGPADVILKPGDTWEQKCRVMYWGENPKPAPISFRIGARNTGHLAAWSTPVTIKIAGGDDEKWARHVAFQKELLGKGPVPTQDGVVKVYYASGKLFREKTYKDGKLNGSYKQYYENGTLQTDSIYTDGKEDSRLYYSNDGTLESKQILHDGKLQMDIHYAKDGSVAERWSYDPVHCLEDDSSPKVLQMMKGFRCSLLRPSQQQAPSTK